MKDPVKFLAFPLAGVSGYLASAFLLELFRGVTGLGRLPDAVLLVAGVSFATGVLVDEIIPGYIDHLREGGGGGDIGGDIDSDLDLDS